MKCHARGTEWKGDGRRIWRWARVGMHGNQNETPLGSSGRIKGSYGTSAGGIPTRISQSFAAVFGTTAPPALGELTLELFPLATLVISVIAGCHPLASSLRQRFLMTTQRPVLHILGVVSNSKLPRGENINITGKVLSSPPRTYQLEQRVGILISKRWSS